MKLNFNFSGKTLLKDWWKIVRDNFTAIQTDHNELSDSVNTHKTAKVIDHPDKSVTSTKIADKAIHTEHIANYAITKDKVVNGAVTTDKITDKSITVNKLALDIVADLGKANTFLYSDGEPICLSEYKDTSGGYEVPDIPVNVFFKLENDTDSILTKFQTADDHYTTLSCDIAPGEVRICVLIKEEVSGADPQNGYLFVLDDSDVKKLISSEIQQRQNADNALQRSIDTETNNRQTGDSELQQKIDTETADRKTADSSIEGKISTETSDRKKADSSLEIKISDEVNSRQEADDELKGKIEYGESERQAIIEDINELENGKVGSNDRVTGKEMNYSVTELLKWVAEGLEKSNSVNYPGLDYIISDVYEMYNALCSYGFQEPIEVVKTVAELKKQAENK